MDWAPAENDILSSNFGITWNEDAYMDTTGTIQNGYSADFYFGDDYAFFPFQHQLDLYFMQLESKHLYMTPHNFSLQY